jgi:hypothetical protein
MPRLRMIGTIPTLSRMLSRGAGGTTLFKQNGKLPWIIGEKGGLRLDFSFGTGQKV